MSIAHRGRGWKGRDAEMKIRITQVCKENTSTHKGQTPSRLRRLLGQAWLAGHKWRDNFPDSQWLVPSKGLIN